MRAHTISHFQPPLRPSSYYSRLKKLGQSADITLPNAKTDDLNTFLIYCPYFIWRILQILHRFMYFCIQFGKYRTNKRIHKRI